MIAIAFIGLFAVIGIMCIMVEAFEWIDRKRSQEPVKHIPTKKRVYVDQHREWEERIMKD